MGLDLQESNLDVICHLDPKPVNQSMAAFAEPARGQREVD
jgi:hypothetical protein